MNVKTLFAAALLLLPSAAFADVRLVSAEKVNGQTVQYDVIYSGSTLQGWKKLNGKVMYVAVKLDAPLNMQDLPSLSLLIDHLAPQPGFALAQGFENSEYNRLKDIQTKSYGQTKVYVMEGALRAAGRDFDRGAERAEVPIPAVEKETPAAPRTPETHTPDPGVPDTAQPATADSSTQTDPDMSVDAGTDTIDLPKDTTETGTQIDRDRTDNGTQTAHPAVDAGTDTSDLPVRRNFKVIRIFKDKEGNERERDEFSYALNNWTDKPYMTREWFTPREGYLRNSSGTVKINGTETDGKKNEETGKFEYDYTGMTDDQGTNVIEVEFCKQNEGFNPPPEPKPEREHEKPAENNFAVDGDAVTYREITLNAGDKGRFGGVITELKKEYNTDVTEAEFIIRKEDLTVDHNFRLTGVDTGTLEETEDSYIIRASMEAEKTVTLQYMEDAMPPTPPEVTEPEKGDNAITIGQP